MMGVPDVPGTCLGTRVSGVRARPYRGAALRHTTTGHHGFNGAMPGTPTGCVKRPFLAAPLVVHGRFRLPVIGAGRSSKQNAP